MSAQGKPGYFVDRHTGIPIGHVDGPGCTCGACAPDDAFTLAPGYTQVLAETKLHIGATGGALVGLVAPCDPCKSCGAGAFDQPATASMYVHDHKASIQCNACGSWRVL